MAERQLSQHPVDILIRQIIAGARRATSSDVEQIIEHIATAPFNPDVAVVPRSQRGLVYLGDRLGSRAASVIVHLTKRVLVERQWSNGTTVEQYLDDWRRFIRHRTARLALLERRGGSMAISMTATVDIVPIERRGPRSLPVFVVVYTADRGIIVSGYQASEVGMVAIPGDMQWLT